MIVTVQIQDLNTTQIASYLQISRTWLLPIMQQWRLFSADHAVMECRRLADGGFFAQYDKVVRNRVTAIVNGSPDGCWLLIQPAAQNIHLGIHYRMDSGRQAHTLRATADPMTVWGYLCGAPDIDAPIWWQECQRPLPIKLVMALCLLLAVKDDYCQATAMALQDHWEEGSNSSLNEMERIK